MTLAIEPLCLAIPAPDRPAAAGGPAHPDITGRCRAGGTSAPHSPQITENDTAEAALLPTGTIATAASAVAIGEPDATFPITPPR